MRTQKDWSRFIERLLIEHEQKALNYIPAIVRAHNIERDESLRLVREFLSRYGSSVNSLRTRLTQRERFELASYLSGNSGELIQPFNTNRLGGLLSKLTILALPLAVNERQISTRLYASSFQSSLKAINSQLAGALGSPVITDLPRTIERILDTRWQAGTYSTRVWKNAQQLSESLPQLVGQQLQQQFSYQEIEQAIRQRFKVARSNSLRLVRTETNFFFNLSELESYRLNGVEYYKLLVTLDERTSQICIEFANRNRTYKVENAVIGLNYPPFHPNERTTSIPVFRRGERFSSAGRRSKLMFNNSDVMVNNTKLQILNKALEY